jgi:diguanylate cyclase
LSMSELTMLRAKNLEPLVNFCPPVFQDVAQPWLDSEADEVGLDTLAPLARPAPSSDMAVRDWDESLRSVKARLRQAVGERLATAPGGAATELAGRVQASAVECMVTLDRLHAALKHELGRRLQLEAEVHYAQNALAQARAELVGTQAGERRARHLSLHDSLTTLPNRSFFRERLDHALAHAEFGHQTLAVLYVDLDGFKRINDVHGHDAGDEMLRIVAARMRRAVRTEDMVSRLGGDEFACLLAELPPGRTQLVRLAGKLFDAVSAPYKIGKLRLTVRPSIGIAMGPADGTSAEILLKCADTAMYRAKRQQTGHEFFDQPATP